MLQRRSQTIQLAAKICLFLLLAFAPMRLSAGPELSAGTSFSGYVYALETRLAQQHRSGSVFLAVAGLSQQSDARLRRGETILEKLSPSPDPEPAGAMLHHWRGTAFAPGATAADFERLMRDFNAYPQRFSPQILRAKILSQQGDRFQVTLRVRQRHVITVVMDTTYEVAFSRLDAQHGSSISRSVQISEIDSPGTIDEHALDAKHEHGFLWRLNSYWSYEERDGGLFMQIESVSLTRSIPQGLGWALKPFVESVPRESLEFTLRSVCNALRK